jgi:hypothetical protein
MSSTEKPEKAESIVTMGHSCREVDLGTVSTETVTTAG